jgi:hypothetical protein
VSSVTTGNDKVTNLTGYTNADAFAGVKVGLFKKQVTNYEIITVEFGISATRNPNLISVQVPRTQSMNRYLRQGFQNKIRSYVR